MWKLQTMEFLEEEVYSRNKINLLPELYNCCSQSRASWKYIRVFSSREEGYVLQVLVKIHTCYKSRLVYCLTRGAFLSKITLRPKSLQLWISQISLTSTAYQRPYYQKYISVCFTEVRYNLELIFKNIKADIMWDKDES